MFRRDAYDQNNEASIKLVKIHRTSELLSLKKLVFLPI